MCEGHRFMAFLIKDLYKSLLAVTGGYGQKTEKSDQKADWAFNHAYRDKITLVTFFVAAVETVTK